jgi:hypothetical protein
VRWKRKHNVRARRLSGLTGSFLLVAALCGCSDGQSQAGSQTSVLPKEDMPPVILVPGAEGSTLVTKNGRPMWDADLWSFSSANLFTRRPPPLPSAGAAKAKLVPHDLVRGLLWQDYYGGLIDTIERRIGAPCVLPGAGGANTRCVPVPWDWPGVI